MRTSKNDKHFLLATLLFTVFICLSGFFILVKKKETLDRKIKLINKENNVLGKKLEVSMKINGEKDSQLTRFNRLIGALLLDSVEKDKQIKSYKNIFLQMGIEIEIKEG